LKEHLIVQILIFDIMKIKFYTEMNSNKNSNFSSTKGNLKTHFLGKIPILALIVMYFGIALPMFAQTTNCPSTSNRAAGWHHNAPNNTANQDNVSNPNSFGISSAGTMSSGSGINYNINASRADIGNINTSSLSAAMSANDYARFPFTTNSSGPRKLDQIYYARDNQGTRNYSIGVTLTPSGGTEEIILQDVFVQNNGSYFQEHKTTTGNNIVQPNTTYELRVYFYNFSGGNARHDDFGFNLTNVCTVIPDPTITANDDDFSATPIDATAGGTTASVFDDNGSGEDDADGSNATNGNISNNINITDIDGLTGVSINNNGTIDVPANSASGTYNIVYEICLQADNTICNTATATIVVCAAGTTAPTLSATSEANVCPTATADLLGLVSSTPPSGAVVQWHTVASNPTSGNKVANPTMIIAGTYYAYYYDSAANCYSPASAAITVTISTCPCTDPDEYADNCDFDGDGVFNIDDIDDDNDGILDLDEMNCATEGNAASAIETGGVTNKDLATGTIETAGTTASSSNSANMAGGDVLTLTLDSEQPIGTVLTFSMADRNGNGEITVTDEGTGSLSIINSDWGTEDVLEYFTFTLTAPTDVLTFTRDNGQIWVDGVSYCSAYADLNSDTDGIPNRFDLDSDDDGCSDAFEAGATTNSGTDFQFSDVSGDIDGLSPTVDAAGDGSVDYTLNYANATDAISSCPVCNDPDNYDDQCDFDGDGIVNGSDIDDDNDGILDSVEDFCLEENLVVNGAFNSNPNGNWDLNYPNGVINYNTSRNSGLTGGVFAQTSDENLSSGGVIHVQTNVTAVTVSYDFPALVENLDYQIAFDLEAVHFNPSAAVVLVNIWNVTESPILSLYQMLLILTKFGGMAWASGVLKLIII